MRAIRKNAINEIFGSKSRFFSIFAIVMIGIGFFAGVKVSAPDMKLSADVFYEDGNLADYRVISTLGFSENDINALKEAGVHVYPAYFTDVLLQDGDEYETARIMSLNSLQANNDVNMLTLVEGRFPENGNECLIDSGGLITQKKVGDKIYMTGEDIGDTLSVTEYTVVGLFNSPMFIDKSARGSTTIGNGSISNLVYVWEENFKTGVYTEVYITAESLREFAAYSKDYGAASDALKDVLEEIGEDREIERYDEILAQAQGEIDDAQAELDDARAEANRELDDAKAKLDDALAEIEQGEVELEDVRLLLEESKTTLSKTRAGLDSGWVDYEAARTEFYDRIAKAQNTLTKSENGYNEAYKAYTDAVAVYNNQLADWVRANEDYQQKFAEWQAQSARLSVVGSYYAGEITAQELVVLLEIDLSDYLEQLAPETAEEADGQAPLIDDEQLVLVLAQILPPQEELAAAQEQLAQAEPELEAGGAELSAAKTQLDEAKLQLDENERLLGAAKTKLENGETQLESEREAGQQQLDDALQKLNNGEIEYKNGVEEYRNGELQYADGIAELRRGRDEYEDGLAEYEEQRLEAMKKLDDAQQEITNAKRDLAEISNPTWYVYDRAGFPGYTEYGENADRVNNIAQVFPLFFILVAGLVCLTTMTRMVEEQRVQIGTLKALGYTNVQIVTKYLLYAMTATVLGALAGIVIGQKLFPAVIISAYSMLYEMPVMLTPIDWLMGFAALLVAAAAVSVTVLLACKTELREQPAQLMRPKAPRVGKRIFLERTPIWRLFSFNAKVTARNLFRYKRRMLMTVIGVAGCTALMLTGFALRDSIGDVVSKQYGELILSDGMVAYDAVDAQDEQRLLDLLSENGTCTKYFQKSLSVTNGDITHTAYLVVPQDEAEIEKYYVFRSRTTGEQYHLSDDNVLIDEKLSLLLGLSAGDAATIYSDEAEQMTVTVEACIENYPSHYVYMTKAQYERLFGEPPEYNVITFTHEGLDDEAAENAFAEELMATGAALSVNFNTSMSGTFSTMLATLDSVVVVLILSAGLLAFVVLYNLTNININERLREIATLKVLGFYDREVDGYIFRENLLLSLMGIAAGLFGGVFLARFVISTAEIDLVMFGREINPLSFLYAAALTFAFSLIVSLYMHFRLIRVNMIDALKSVE